MGYAWVPIEHAGAGTRLEIESPEGAMAATVTPIPFLDPKKSIPANS
jgi:glycine cleavage system aminomethyltransferase T